MNSKFIQPNWKNLKHQRQEQADEGEESIKYSFSSSHVPNNNSNQLLQNPRMSNYEVAELTWENGQLAMHGFGGLLNPASTRPTWGRTNETLESIVHEATSHKPSHQAPPPNLVTSTVGSSDIGKCPATSSSHQLQVVPSLAKKRLLSESNKCVRNFIEDEHVDRSACASASAAFCRDNDTTTAMTWTNSLESSRSFKTKTADEDSACHGGSDNRDEERETKTETVKSHSNWKSRAAAVHNQSERRRRDRINQKMKALQRLVPNANKTDKASMLDEVIDYLKQLKAQVQMMTAIRNMSPQMMMMQQQQQQQLQMSLLARMGMGVGLGIGMGMLDMNAMPHAPTNAQQSLPPLMHPNTAALTPSFVAPAPFVAPQALVPQPASSDSGNSCSVPLQDQYCAFLAQSMNMELYNKMAAMYLQQMNQNMVATSTTNPSQTNHIQGD